MYRPKGTPQKSLFVAKHYAQRVARADPCYKTSMCHALTAWICATQAGHILELVSFAKGVNDDMDEIQVELAELMLRVSVFTSCGAASCGVFQ